ncbi:MAG: DUF115 domain-containing protein [Methanomassiliicoccaceae archaeon]|nr:DUF115 domain-containing protein [Methanomassiliicoccaceae archaeon]
MRFSEWEPVYEEIIKDLGIERTADGSSARLLKMLTLNSDMISEDELREIIRTEAVVVGGNVSNDDINILCSVAKERTMISAGSATDVLVMNNIIPDIVVTDLDGDTEKQKKASSFGSVTLIHAHGDNTDLIMEHAKNFKGKIMITTQSSPDTILSNFGGFTDGDRAVCLARHFGVKNITLIGFNFDTPAYRSDTDMEMKKRKLKWAKKIIFDMNPFDVLITDSDRP